jgi:hypothetical protein
MLCRVSCKSCHISCLWTDDPEGFLESVCLRYRHCQAKLTDEGFDETLVVKRAKSVLPSQLSAGKGVIARVQGRRPPARH